MDIKNFKCDGVGYTAPANNVRLFIQTTVSLYKMRNSSDDILEKIQQINPLDDYYFGLRFSNNDAVTTRICSGLVELASSETNKSEEMEENIESFINSLSAPELDKIIIEGLRCCASADHWYNFEKEWN